MFLLVSCEKLYFILLWAIVFGLQLALSKNKEEIKLILVAALVFSLSISIRTAKIDAQAADYRDYSESEIFCTVISFPKINNEEIVVDLKNINDKTTLRCYLDREVIEKIPGFGDKILVSGNVKKPPEKRNPGGFDYRLYLKAYNIDYLIYAEAASVLEEQSNFAIKSISDLRERIIRVLDSNLEENERDFAKGILFGEKNLSDEYEDMFVKAGISHILAVSGLHVGIIYSFFYTVFTCLKVSVKVQFAVLSIFLIFYSCMCGLSVSVVRASLMVLINMYSRITKYHYDPINAIFLVGCINLCINPYKATMVSFLLSYGAVFSISVFYPLIAGKFKIKNFIIKNVFLGLILTITIQIFTYPILACNFNGISPLSIILNILAVPLAGVLLIALIIGVFLAALAPFSADMVFGCLSMIIDLIFILTKYFYDLPFSYIRVFSLEPLIILMYYMFLFYVFGYFQFENKYKNLMPILFAAMFMCVLIGNHFNDKSLKVTFFDVGQGDSVLIEMPGNIDVLIDGGGNLNKNVGEDVVLKALLHKGISDLDLVILTHTHFDHSKGIQELIGNHKIKRLVLNNLEDEKDFSFLEEATKMKIDLIKSEEGDIFRFGKQISLEVIYPLIGDEYVDSNNSSLVTRLVYDQISFIFTGDIEEYGERKIIERNNEIQSTILKVAHHGSDSSTSEAFLDSIDPKMAVISVGENNRYAHPADKTLELMSNKGIKYYRTDLNGAVMIETDGKKIWTEITCEE
ncbi:DNA internalization-related competence protein ComEC/Rec2 [Alkalibacter mobilis]|uniref:DNA internalization-related competence protein ComEC/Rec2 n=1 Tax=Alkalibacter mobilis TaxID=2787712 RepID=UPI00189ECA0B|nr:DNA internalization-related competence protein ComEC/Rec2 [Alkalibacter mobilis]MBF7096566.1 DNA internalization-related competence protein ComEC/Rec2 [Alkalibacter mobilis]